MNLSFSRVEKETFAQTKAFSILKLGSTLLTLSILVLFSPVKLSAQHSPNGLIDPEIIESKRKESVSVVSSKFLKSNYTVTPVTDKVFRASAGDVVINEIVTDPQTDWSTNGFDGTDGGGTVSQGVDEWVELYVKTGGLDLTGWTIELIDGSDVIGDLTSSGAFQTSNYLSSGSGTFTNTEAGDYIVLGNVASSSQMSNSITIILKDASSNIIDQVTLGGGADEAPDGGSTDASDESIQRVPNGSDTDTDNVDFVQGAATLGRSNSNVNSDPTFTTNPVTSVDNDENEYVYRVETTDSDGNDVTITGTTIPDWLTAEIESQYLVSTIAGLDGSASSLDGTGSDARFYYPVAITADSDGNLLIGEISAIRKMTPEGVVTTFVDHSNLNNISPQGLSVTSEGVIYLTTPSSEIYKINPGEAPFSLAGLQNNFSYLDGSGSNARFNGPEGIAVGPDGNIYIADKNNNRIRKVTPEGNVTTFAGNGTSISSENANPLLAGIREPRDLEFDSEGNLFVTTDYRIARIDGSTGSVTTFFTDANTPVKYHGLALFGSDVFTFGDDKIYKINANAELTDVAGIGTFPSILNGPGNTAAFRTMNGIAIDAKGDLYVTNTTPAVVRKVETPRFKISGDPEGHVGSHNVVLTASDGFGGSDVQSFVITVNDVIAPIFSSLTNVSVNEDVSTSFYTATATDESTLTFSLGSDNDESNFNLDSSTGELSFKTAPDFENPTDNDSDNNYVITITVTDANSNLTNQTVGISVLDIDQEPPTVSITRQSPTAENAPSTEVTFRVTFNENVSNISVADFAISGAAAGGTASLTSFSEVTASSTFDITVSNIDATGELNLDFAGDQDIVDETGNAFGGTISSEETYTISVNTSPTFTSTPVTSVNSNETYSYAVSTNDGDGHTVTITGTTLPDWLTAELGADYQVTTLAGPGDGTPGTTNGTGSEARFDDLNDIEIDGDGNFIIAEKAIRKITPQGVVTAVTSTAFANVWNATGITVADDGTIYFASTNDQIFKHTTEGLTSALAGYSNGEGYLDGTGTIPTRFRNPAGLDMGPDGNIYVADYGNHRIRKVTPDAEVTTFAGDGNAASTENADPLSASIEYPLDLVFDNEGNLFVATGSRIARIDGSTGAVTTFAVNDGSSGIFLALNIDSQGNLFATTHFRKIYKIDTEGSLTRIAGSGSFPVVDGVGSSASFATLGGLALDADGNIYVAAKDERSIRLVSAPGFKVTGDPSGQVGDHNVTLTASDGFGGSVTQSFTITVNDITDPVFTSGTSVSVDEGTSSIIYTAAATDESILTFSLGSGNDESLFNIDSSTGELTFKSAPDFEDPLDGNTDNDYVVNIVVTDTGGNTVNQDVTITVDDVDEVAPQMTGVSQNSTTSLNVIFDEAVQVLGSNPTDFTVKDDNNNSFVVSSIADGTPGDTQITLTLADFSTASGDLTVTYANNNNEVTDLAGNALATNSTGVSFDEIGPAIAQDIRLGLDANSNQVDITFSEGVFGTNGGSGAVEASDFSVALSNNSTVDTPVITSITNTSDGALTGGETTLRFNFSYNGTARGDENLTFTPVADAVFDISGNAASTTQSNNVLQLHDETDPTITRITLAEASGSHNVDLTYYIDVEFSEGVYGATFDDFDLDVVNSATVILHNATQTNGDALVGGETTIRLNVTLNTYGTSEGSAINVTVNAESIFDQANNDVPLFDQTTTETIDQALPAVVALFVDAANSVLTVYFNEAIYADNGASLPIEASDLSLSVSEGSATGVSITNLFGQLDADLTGGESQVRVHFSLTGTPNGEERLTINAADNSSIFDGSGNTMVSPQLSNNHRLINDIYAPVFSSGTTVNFVENGEGTVYTAVATDIGTVTYSLANSNDEALFNIDGSTGVVSFKVAPDFENAEDADSNNDYVIGVIATDDQGNASELELTISVTDSDEIAPLFISASTASYAENGEETVYIAIATDGDNVTYSLADANDEEFFNIDSSTGELTFKVAPDFEAPQDADLNNSYVLVVKAIDGESNESTLEVTVTVTDLDENAPVFISASTASYVENGEGTVYTAIATDVGTVTYSLADSNDEEFFNLNASTGVLTFIAAPDFENSLDADGNNSYVLVLKATDDSANESTIELVVTVTDLDEEVPVFTSLTTVSFDENASGTVYTTTVSDDSENITFSLGSDKDESAFSIDGSTGVLTFVSPPDFENPSSESGSNNYEIDIKATDQAKNESTLTLIISVNDLDEVAPVFTSSSSASFAENDEGTIYTAVATDDGVITYSLGDSNDEEFFNLDGSNGQLTFKVAPDFENPQDADLNNSYVLVLIATDDSGNESTLELTITVTSQNEDPIITSNPITEIDDDQIYTYQVTTTDPDGDDVTVTSNALPSWLSLYGENGVVTFAGNGQSGSTNANLLSSSFNIPIAVAEDSQGNLYVADLFNHTIRRISTNGQVTTFAGTGSAGSQDGTGTEASFNEPSDLAIDSQDNIFVVDRENDAIRKITPTGVVTYFVGGTEGYQDGTGTAAWFDRPTQIAIDDNDNLFITDQNNFRIRKITSAGVVTTIAGSGVNGFQDGDSGTAQFSQLTGIGVDGEGNVYVSDYDNRRIRKIDIVGNVTTLAGSDTRSVEDGLGSQASFYSPLGIDVDEFGNVYVAEDARVIRKIEPSGQVTTIAGAAFDTGTDDGAGVEAKFTAPNNVFIDTDGNLFITEGLVHLIRKVVVNGPILTGNPSGQSGAISIALTADDGSGGTHQQSFTITINDVTAPVFTSSGTASFTENAEGTVYMAVATDAGTISYSLGASVDEEYFTIDSNTGEITFLSTPDFETPLDGDANNSYVLIVKATDAATNESTLELMITVSDVDEDAPVFTSAESISYNENALGAVYTAVATDEGTITYSLGNSVDEEYFSIDSNTGEITFLSTPDFENPLDGDANNTYALIIKATDSEGNESTLELLISVIDLNEEPVISSSPITTINSSEEYDYTIEVSDPDDDPVQLEMTQGPSWLKLQRTYTTVETFAGSGNADNVNGQGVNASFGSVSSIAIDNSDNVFVGVSAAHVLKKIDKEGNVTTYAGILGVGGSVDGSLQEATFGHFTAITFDNDGNLFVVDGSERKIRKISTQGLVTTVAGSGVDAVVNGSASEAAFSSPVDIAVDSQGNLFIAESNDHTIRKIDTDGNVSTFAGSGLSGFVNANGADAYFNSPTSLVIDSEDNLYVTDISNFHIRKITPQGEVTSYVGKRAFGNVDAQGENAVFSSPYRLAIDSDDNLYVTELLDFFPPTIRKVDTEQNVTTIAGSTEGYLDGAALEAQFGRTLPLDVDSKGRIYIADEDNYRVRRVNSVITLTGDPEGQVGDYNISLSASDGNGAQAIQAFTLTVTDNESPAFTSASTASFSENNQGTVYTAVATDAGTITYSLGTSVDEEYFNIDSSTGVITFLSTPDFENPLDGDANNSYVLIVKATDNEGNESTLELMVTVTDVDEDDPVFTSGTTTSFSENTGGTVYTAVATDAGTITYSLGTSVDEEYFSIDSNTGEITFLSTPDFEAPLDGDANNSYVLIVKATDNEGNESTLELMVTVTDIDEDRPVFTSAEAASFTENAEGTVYTAVAEDEGTITYSLGTSVDEEYFNIDSSTGVITFLSAPDFENPLDGDANNSYVLIVKATDNEGNESTLELMVTVTDVDEDRPVFTSASSASFTENASGTVYTTVAEDEGAIIYSLGTSVDEEYFTIDSNTGEITFLSTPDFENPLDGDANNSYVLIVKATDTEGNESTLELMITVTDVDEDRPVFTSPETTNFIENSGATVYTAVATDAGTITYSLGTSVDEEYFNIDSNTGVITFLSAPDFENPLDGDANNSYVLIVKATDNEGNESTLELMVTVTDVDEDGPVFTSPQNYQFDENLPIGEHAYAASSNDDSEVTYSLGSGNDEGLFNMDGQFSNAIYFNNSPDYESPQDSNGDNIYTIEIIATDAFNNAVSLLVNLTVNNVNESNPVISTSSDLFVEEGSTEITLIEAIGFEEGFDVSFSKSGGADLGFFFMSTDGVLSFRNAPDYEFPTDSDEDNVYQIEITAHVGERTSSKLFSVTVKDVIESAAPSIISEPVATVDEGQEYAYSILAEDPNNDDFDIEIVSGPEWLSLNKDVYQVITYAGTSDNEYENGYRLVAGFDEPRDIVQDSEGNFFVLDANKIRKIKPNGEVVAFAGTGGLGAQNGAGEQATFRSPSSMAIDSDDNIYIVDSGNYLIRKVTPSGEVSTIAGTGNSQYLDGVGESASFVYPTGIVVDASGNLYIADQSDNRIRKIASDGSVSTFAGTGVAGLVNGLASEAQFNGPTDIAIDSEGNLYVTEYSNYTIRKITQSGEVSTLAGSTNSAIEDGNGVNASFQRPHSISIGNEGNLLVSDGHAIRKITPEGTVATLAGTFQGSLQDGVGSQARFSGPKGILVVNNHLYVADEGNRRIRKVSKGAMLTGTASGVFGDFNIELKVSDAEDGFNNQNFTITVLDNTAPVFTSLAAVSFAENSTETAYQVAVTDNNPNGQVTFTLFQSMDGPIFNLDPNTGVLTFKEAPDFESPQDRNSDNAYLVTIEAKDQDQNSSTHQVTITVEDVDDDILEGSLSISDVTRAENSDGGSTTDFIFTVTLSGNVASSFTVDYGTGDNTATTAGSDYNNTSGTLNFAGTAGETQQIIVTVNNDDILEGDETFGVQLVNLQANGQSITITDDTGIGTITNDDQSTLSISDVTKVEGNSGATDFNFSVTMTGAVDQQVTVDYATSDGTATIANGDYNSTSGTLTFSGADGESQIITVAVNGDNIEESNESFTISLSNIQDGGKGVSFAKSTAVATIANDDDNVAPSGFSVAFDDQSIGGNEVSSSTFTFSGAEIGTTYNYSITSAGGGTTVTGSGTIATEADQISIPDLSGLNDGLLTLSATLTDGSSNISNSQRSTTNLDKTGPIPTITSSSSGLIFTKTITATIRFNEAITGFTIDNLSSTNSVLSNFTGSGTTYTVLMTASADGEMTLTVPANITEDGLGNKNTVSNILLTKVEAFNAAPSGLALSDKTITEKLPVGTVIGAFSTTDPDDNDRHQYSLIAGDGGVNNNLFQIVDNQLITKEVLNFQNIQMANIRVRTTDLRGSSFEKSFDIEVINQPEPRALVRFIYPSGYTTNQYNFGRLFVGQEASVVLQVSNVGIDGDLNVSDIKLPDGYEASETEFVVAQGETQKIEVKFSPKESKYFSGYGQVISNGGSPQFQISGYGLINQPPVAFDFPLRSIESNDRVVTLGGYDPEGSRIEFVITQSPQKGSFIDATTSSDRRQRRFLPQAGLTPGRYKDEFKFKVREVATGLESEEASGEFYFEILDTKHEINDISIIERTDDYMILDLTFTDETVNSSYYFALRTFESYYSSFRGRTRYYWNLFYQNNFSHSEIETQNSILKHRFRLTGTAMQKLTSSGQVWVNLQLRDDRGLSQSFYIKVINDESGTKINVVNEGTEDGEFVVFGEDKSLPENETVDIDLSALEFGGFDLEGATIEISDNPLYGTVGEPSLVENSGEFARWRVSYTSTSETQQVDSIGFIVSHPARDEQFKAFARLEIIEVPDQPLLSSIDDQQIQEDESLSLKLDYSDPDSELSVSVTSTDSDNVSLQVVDGTLSVIPNQNYNGNVEILVTVTEADSNDPTSVLETFNLQILPVNDQPIMSAITDTQVNEDNSIELKLQASDADEELATFEYTATTDQPENVEMSIEADVMIITPVTDFNGDLTFYVKADDGEGTLSSVSEAETFVLKVNPVNDSPEVSRTIATQSIVEGLPAYTIDLSDYFSDPDVESSELTYTVGSVSNVSLTVNGSILTIQSVDGAEGLETVTITASDGVLSASQDVNFVASASSDEITVANALSDLNLAEDFDLQVIDISDLFAYSSDANAVFTYQLSGNNSVSAAISGTSLEIGALENFNGTDQLYIIGSTDGISAYTQININVSAVNDAPQLVSSISDLSVLEDVAVSRVISNNIFSDVDGDALTYFASFDADWLSFDAATRTFSGTPENKDVGTIEVTLTAEDPSGAKATDTFQIVVSNTNDDPTDIGISATAFDENISLGTAVATLSGTDPDVGDTDFSYSLISGNGDTDNSSFEIVDGQLKTLASINFETKASYSIRVKIMDGFEGSFEKVFAISVNDVNEAATDIALATTFLSENQSPGSVINGFATSDPDSDDTHIYSLVAGEGDTDNESFEIIGGGMASKVKFNFEEKSSYSVRVRAIDAGGLTFEKTFTINISDANDAPTGITSDNLILAENESIGTKVGTLSTTDEDASDSYTYQLVAGNGDTDNNLFGLESGKLVSKGSFNFETKSSYSVRVKSTDKGGLSVEEALTITISDANDAPTAVNSTSLEIAENEAIGTVIGQFTSIDEDTSDEHTYSLISGEGDADNDSFEFDGWNLKAKSSFNFETKSSYSIRVQSSDGKGGTLASQFTVNVTNVLEVELRTESSVTVPTIGVGETETAELVLNNDGEEELEITNITFPEGYSGSFTSVNIAAGSSETLIITFEPAEVGTYSGDITITSNAGTNVVSITGEAEVVAGIEDPMILSSQVKLYPNPASQFVEIDLTDLNGIPADLSIKSIGGADLWNKKKVRESKVLVDISTYVDGAYLILVQTDRGTVTKRLLIRK